MAQVRRYWWLGLLVVVMAGLESWHFWPKNKQEFINPQAEDLIVEKPLQKYSFDNLRQRDYKGSQIKKERLMYKESDYEAWLFEFEVEGKKITGQMNIPSRTDLDGWPVVIMLRGYVDPEVYETGMGTKNGADFLARNGYVTLAPDFLGFGESDDPPNHVFEERFMRPIQVLELIASVKNMEGLDSFDIQIWGHSNGGQVALSVLEISGKEYPTSLWAPVSKSFPYSILYFTDEFSDKGKALRKELSGLEAMYDVDDFDITRYYDWIKAPIQIHQGTSDEAVPL